MKVLVTGANGQLGAEFVNLTAPALIYMDMAVIRWISRALQQCREVFAALRPDIVIHCAAYTAVDKAESEPDEAFRVNAAGTRNIAVAARECGAKLCYVSTDYVFDGKGTIAYNEIDQTNPQTVYGKSKLAGEQLVAHLT